MYMTCIIFLLNKTVLDRESSSTTYRSAICVVKKSFTRKHARLFTYCQWLLPCYKSRADTCNRDYMIHEPKIFIPPVL